MIKTTRSKISIKEKGCTENQTNFAPVISRYKAEKESLCLIYNMSKNNNVINAIYRIA
jgi:hypothetical protein